MPQPTMAEAREILRRQGCLPEHTVEAMGCLSEREYKYLHWHLYAGYTLREIAESEGISWQTVDQVIRRARFKMVLELIR